MNNIFLFTVLQSVRVPAAVIGSAKILLKSSSATQLHGDRRQTDGSCHKPNVTSNVRLISADSNKQEAQLSQRNRARRETARCFVSLNILLSHPRSLKVIRNLWVGRKSLSISLKLGLCLFLKILSVKEWPDLEIGGRGRSRSLEMAPCGRSIDHSPYTTFY